MKSSDCELLRRREHVGETIALFKCQFFNRVQENFETRNYWMKSNYWITSSYVNVILTFLF